MIHQLEIKNFKCFEILRLPLSALTLLAGTNASGKSSLLQSLVLLHQTIRENEWSPRLILNGDQLKLGTVQDVVNKIHGRDEFELAITIDDQDSYRWRFVGERSEMSMQIECLSHSNETLSTKKNDTNDPSFLHRLLPYQFRMKNHISATLESLTYITAERIGPQDFYPLEDRRIIQPVGPKGEYAMSRLYRLADRPVAPDIEITNVAPTLIKQVNAWMQRFFPGCAIDLNRVERMNAITLGIRNSDETDFHRPVNVGFGLTQVLPILIAVLSAMPDDLILIENPEVHLHPAGQALMGQFLAQASNASGPQIILETHSDHVLNGIRRVVRQKKLTPDQVSLHFFRAPKQGLDQVVSPQLDQTGNLDTWPEGFFDQFDKDMNHFAGWGA